MFAEVFRPTTLDEIIGYESEKEILKGYLASDFQKAIILTGSPGIGKTTVAICAAKSCGFDPLEINASRTIRSFEDVEKIKDACRSPVNIHSLLRGETTKKTCVILDEVDGSDPHAQNKIVEWIKDKTRKVPILCTGNELPTIFKRNAEWVQNIRCFPPKAADLQEFFPEQDVASLMKETQHDVRRLIHRIQYGESYHIPKFVTPPTGLPVENMFMLRQKMFDLPDPFHEYRVDRLDIGHWTKATAKYKSDDSHESSDVKPRRQKK